MSLAMYAAPFDNENTQINSKDNDNPIARKRLANNRTQKRVPKEHNYSEKVNFVLQSIHNSQDHSGDSGGLRAHESDRQCTRCVLRALWKLS